MEEVLLYYFKTCTVYLLLFCTMTKNARFFHKLSHSFMIRHYRVILIILRELVLCKF